MHSEVKDALLSDSDDQKKNLPGIFLSAQAIDDERRRLKGLPVFKRFHLTGFIDTMLGSYTAPVDFIHAGGKGIILDILELLYAYLMASYHKPCHLSLAKDMAKFCDSYRKSMAMQSEGKTSEDHR